MKIERPKSKQPIPENAKKVFKGVIFDVYQWEQEMFDGTKKTFEKIKRADTVVVFGVLPDGKILLTEQEQPGKKPFIGATGGMIDEGEDILSAAKRELLEESGYEAEEFTLWDAQQPMSKGEWAVYTFIAKGLKKVADLRLDAGEKIKLKPSTLDELIYIATTNYDDFYEKEVIVKFFEARVDPKKMAELKELFKPLESK
jgi:8-oxo-dGTP pyrophosphatase MutT (NUDIX family)